MHTDIVYQIIVQGKLACFEQSTKIYSKDVYKEKPTRDIINAFIDICCDSENPFANLDRDTVVYKIVELNIH